ncbi:zinc finger, CCHC-type containing protein [Tanacetum coccineum]
MQVQKLMKSCLALNSCSSAPIKISATVFYWVVKNSNNADVCYDVSCLQIGKGTKEKTYTSFGHKTSRRESFVKPVKTKHKVEENAGYNAGNVVVEKIETYTYNKDKGVLKENSVEKRVGETQGNNNNENRNNWKVCFGATKNRNNWKVILEAHGLWEAIEPKENTQVDDKKDKATTAFLYQALTEDVILQVAGCKTARELWESLKKRHVGEERVQQARLQSLMIGFNTLQMKDDDTVDAFTAKLNSYATKAKELGKTLDESLLVRKLLDSTPDRFIQIVASIEQTSDLDDIALDEITGKLKAFEERIKLRKGGQVESQENLLFAQSEHSGKGRRFSKRGGRSNFSRGNWQNNRNKHNSKEGNSTHKGNSNRKKSEWDLSKVRCFKCQKLGHLKKDCRGTSTTQEQSNLILEDDEPSLLMTIHETEHEEVLLNEGQIQPRKYASEDASIWYLDNGASNHMTGTKSHFRNINESITGRIRFGDGSFLFSETCPIICMKQNQTSWTFFVAGPSSVPLGMLRSQ